MTGVGNCVTLRGLHGARFVLIGSASSTLQRWPNTGGSARHKWDMAQGTTKSYLQVMVKNEAAMRLYARLGFDTSYYHHYREEVHPQAEG